MLARLTRTDTPVPGTKTDVRRHQVDSDLRDAIIRLDDRTCVRKVSAGRWPQVGRVIGLLVVLVVLVVLSITLFSLPDRVADLRSICEGEVCAPGQLTPATATALQNNGISTRAYAAWTASLDIAAVTAYLVMAWLLLWRKGYERMALIVGLFFNGLALDTFPLPTLSSMGAPWIEMEAINWSPSIGIGVVLLAAFSRAATSCPVGHDGSSCSHSSRKRADSSSPVPRSTLSGGTRMYRVWNS